MRHEKLKKQKKQRRKSLNAVDQQTSNRESCMVKKKAGLLTCNIFISFP